MYALSRAHMIDTTKVANNIVAVKNTFIILKKMSDIIRKKRTQKRL